jgi:hypothetical protein
MREWNVRSRWSALAVIETRWGLSPLTARDAAANNMLNAFD